MTHAPETGAIHRLRFPAPVSGTCVMHIISRTEFIWYQIPVPIRTLFYFLWLVDDNCLRFSVFSYCYLITNYEFVVYVAFSRVYFWRQKFSFQMHMVQKTGARKWELIYGCGFWRVCHGYMSLEGNNCLWLICVDWRPA